jgi:NO-binding membrane sensor protein with MHYT domain
MTPAQRRLPLQSSRARVWQDAAAEGMLGSAVGVIALTGVNPLVLATNLWLADVAPQIDPVVTMLAVVLLLTAVLVLGAIALKVQARRATMQSIRLARAETRTGSSARAEA